MPNYAPRREDFIPISFDPQAGHEQRGRRPAFVLSNYTFNRRTRLALVCPLTRTDRGIPLHVPVPPTSKLTGFVMVEQVRALDFDARGAEFIESGSAEVVDDVLAVIDSIMSEDFS